MSKRSLVALLVSESLGYSIPAYISGMIISQFVVWYLTSLLEKKGNIDLDGALSSNAILLATVLGIGCSLVAAIFPIISALQQNLRDVLDVRHSGIKMVKFSLNRTDSIADLQWNLLTNCGVLVGFGWFIYYFLPQSLLSGDMARVALMLFALMVGMVIGFVLLGINVQHIIELVVVKMVLFWERRPIPNIVTKNLIAHRLRNRKTAVMYSLSLSFVMMITVSMHSSTATFVSGSLKSHGGHFVLRDIAHSNSTRAESYAILEDLLTGTGEFADLSEEESVYQYVEDFTNIPETDKGFHAHEFVQSRGMFFFLTEFLGDETGISTVDYCIVQLYCALEARFRRHDNVY